MGEIPRRTMVKGNKSLVPLRPASLDIFNSPISLLNVSIIAANGLETSSFCSETQTAEPELHQASLEIQLALCVAVG